MNAYDYIYEKHLQTDTEEPGTILGEAYDPYFGFGFDQPEDEYYPEEPEDNPTLV